MLRKFLHTEYWQVGLIIFIACVFINAPFIYGYFITPVGKVFTGLSYINSNDTYTYLSWVEQAKEGKVLLKSLYTGEQQNSGLLHPLFLLMGKLNYLFDLPNIFIFHLFRTFSSALFLFVVYKFIELWESSQSRRIFLLVMVAFSSGLGWALTDKGTDLWVAESISFFSMYISLLNTFSLALILAIFTIAIKYFNKIDWRAIICSAVLLNLLILVHSYDLGIVLLVLGSYGVFNLVFERDSNFLKSILILTIFSLPAICWQYWTFFNNFAFTVWGTKQTTVPSPEVKYYLAGYGLLLLFSFIQIVYTLSEKKNKYTFLYIWVVSIVGVLYLPQLEDFQRKFTEGFHIPLAILAGMGIMNIVADLKFKWTKYFFVFSFLVTLPISNFFVVKADINGYKTQAYPYYLDQDEVDSIKWLKINHSPEDLLFTSTELANFIPGISGVRIFSGLSDQTVNFEVKSKLVSNVLNGGVHNADNLKGILKINEIDLLLIRNDSMLNRYLDLEKLDFLNIIYQNNTVKIYRVNNTNKSVYEIN